MPHDFEAVERDLFIPSDIALAPCDVDLLVHAVDTGEIRQQQAAPPAALDDDAIALDVELRLVRDAFRCRQDIDVIDEAIEQGKKISFNYNKIGLDKKLHVSKPHVGSPYQMLLHNQRYYLMMFDEMFDEVGFYRMDKITDIEVLDDNSKPLRENVGFEKGIDYKRIATSLPYMYNDAPVAITLKCWIGMADTLYDWFGTNFTAKKLDDKYFVATIVASEKAMLYWVLQYNRNVEVLSPLSLRENVVAKLKKTLALYEND